MRAVVQRVSRAKVEIEGKCSGQIEKGLLVLLGITHADTKQDADWLIKKLVQLRIFNDEEGKMNRSVTDIGGDMLVVSQFTLHANSKKGNRPSYIRAAPPEVAIPLYEEFLRELDAAFPGKVERGEFGAYMQVSLLNDGPVTIILDTADPSF
jgi:D-tyrosyl-tRNA(Tyr) deacylase